MKIAITKSTLRIPPTYFAVAHAQQLKDSHDFRIFTLVADVQDKSISVPITDFVPGQLLGFRRRELVMPAFMPAMSLAIRRFQPDIIHQHFATWSRPAVDAARLSKVPLITTLHGSDVVSLGNPPDTMMAKWHHRNVLAAAAQSQRILAVSHYLADRAIELGLDADKIEVHYQGVDTEYFVPNGHDANETPIVLFVGTLNTQKGIRDLIDASLAVWRKAHHRLVVIGDGPLRDAVVEQAASHPHIDFLGRMDREGIRTWMQKAYALVAPSQEAGGAREAAGLVALEAQACGTPLLAYRSGGIPEMLDEGTTGLLAGEADFAQLRDGLLQLLSLRSGDYLAMRRAARQFVVEHRSLAGSSRQLDAHYRSVGALA
ncbi:glycosyl transferase group 1 [Arthrobacter crystallopoietes BAB-32]|uniref:D-inositol 3-phosphate glycosyltransferase n=1 Tax=Arthrobacter crystallopoietes BAB-32 TaxID=1246476 RepID=N1UZ43_9MICC|nr:glycosyltransferase [Arthrobacter crystallopoietes]EMY35671.1 glycosyl transferase group 1 [Arthrobacter crystallopoietes BAB-32]